jgi:citronellol/citronellal dehydrogenase
VLVTGGGTGLGMAAAAELVRSGAPVVIAGRREELLGGGGRRDRRATSAVAGDVRDAANARRLVEFTLAAHGRLDVLVDSGAGQYFVRAEAIVPKGWRAVHRLNVGATELMTRTAYELAFVAQRSGAVSTSRSASITGRAWRTRARLALPWSATPAPWPTSGRRTE